MKILITKQKKLLVIIVLFFGMFLWLYQCKPYNNKINAKVPPTYIIKILPSFSIINDGLLRDRKCLQGEVNGEKILYCQGIDGFEYEEGYEYELEITEKKMEYVPADNLADRKYILKKIISKKKVVADSLNYELKEISIDTEFEESKTNSVDYMYVFPVSADGNSFGTRVATFENLQQWKEDTKKQLAASNIIMGQDYILEKMGKDISTKIDFSKENLIIVCAHTGGPPFGELKYVWKNNTYQFYMEEPKTNVAGMALKTYFHFYKTNKPNKAVWIK